MQPSKDSYRWTAVREWLTDPTTRRQWLLGANDGIIATAGILQGFAGAGAGDRLLLFSATAATIAGGLSIGGAKWAEDAAEREAQLRIVEAELSELARDPEAEVRELAAHWEARGLEPDLARDVAERLTEHDALAAQLESEYGFEDPMPAAIPVLSGLGICLAFVAGALIPLTITYVAPVAVETRAILAAVAVALVLTSFVSARASRLSASHTIARSLTVGAITLLVSYLAGEFLLG